MIVKKVSTPEDGLKKIAKVNDEIDKQLAILSPNDPKQVELAEKLKELKGLEDAFLPVETGLVGKGAVLTDERLKACDLVSRNMTETKKLCGELVKVDVAMKDQFKPLEKAVADQLPIKLAAKYNFNFMSAAGTAILIAAFLSALLCGVGMGDTFRIAVKTLYDMRFPALTVASVLGLAYVMNALPMT